VSRDPASRDLEIEQAQLRGFARSIADVEWLLLILVMLYLFVSRPELAQEPVLIAVLVGFAAFVLLVRYARPLAARTRLKIGLGILAMVVFLTAVLAFPGDGMSPLANLYLLPIITAALALGKRATALVMLLVIACYLSLVTAADGEGAWSAALVTQAVGVLAPFVLVAFLATLLADNMHTANERIRALSDRDELTGLYNIRAFTRLAAREHEIASRAEQPYSLLMVDINHLKAVNDVYGHEAGNRAVMLVADSLRRITRSTDLAGRFGGDEFIVLLSNADRAVASEVAQRVRNVVFSTTLEVDGKIVRLKVAVGVGSHPDDGGTMRQVMAAADRAMYKDKEAREPKGKLIIQHRR
jgi:diguanylate cyclase (GGDEF)-like protein